MGPSSNRQFFFNPVLLVTRYRGQLSSCKISEKTNDPILRKLSDAWTDRQTDRQTDKQTDRPIDRWTERWTYRRIRIISYDAVRLMLGNQY